MATEIKAVESIIEWDAEMGRMAILNPGDVAEVGDTLATAKIDAGMAEKFKAKKKGRSVDPAPEPDVEPVADDAPPADDSEDGAPV